MLRSSFSSYSVTLFSLLVIKGQFTRSSDTIIILSTNISFIEQNIVDIILAISSSGYNQNAIVSHLSADTKRIIHVILFVFARVFRGTFFPKFSIRLIAINFARCDVFPLLLAGNR